MQTLQNKIMRRIYYAYALRLISLPGVWQSVLMLLSIVALTRFVSIGNVLQNISEVRVGELGGFFYGAARSTEIWTLLLIGVVVYCLISLRISLHTRYAPYSLARG